MGLTEPSACPKSKQIHHPTRILVQVIPAEPSGPSSPLRRMKFFQYQLTPTLQQVDLLNPKEGQPQVVNCLNPHSFVTAEADPQFKEALLASSLLLPDGVGICIALKRWRGETINKIAGEDFHFELLRQLEASQGRVFYLGSSPRVLSLIEQHIHRDYPHITVQTHSPSYSTHFSDDENAEMLHHIQTFAPDALLVGMTAPKQEKWVYSNLSQLTQVKVIGSIGAVFEFFAGTIKRAPRWAIKLRIEWLYRFIQEPKRMWQRNFISTPRYLRYIRRHHSNM